MKSFKDLCSPKSNKTQSITNSQFQNSSVVQVLGDLILDENLLEQLRFNKNDICLLNELAKQSLADCEAFIIDNDLHNANKILDTLFDYGIDSLNDDNKNYSYYLKSLIYLIEDNKEGTLRNIKLIQANVFTEEKIVINSLANHICSSIDSIDNKSVLLNTVIVLFLFRIQEHDFVCDKYVPAKDTSHTFDYVYGLSAMNLSEFDKAVDAFKNAISKRSLDKYHFFKCIAEINVVLQILPFEDPDTSYLHDIYDNLLSYGEKCVKIKDDNLLLYNRARLGSLLLISKEEFIVEYNLLTSEQKTLLENLLAVFYSLSKDYVNASIINMKIFSQYPSEQILAVLFNSYFLGEDYNSIIQMKASLEEYFSFSAMCNYLLACREVDRVLYEEELFAYFSKYSENIESHVYFLEASKGLLGYDRRIYKSLISCKKNWDSLPNQDKVILAFFVAEQNNIELSLEILSATKDFNQNDLEHAYVKLSKLSNIDTREYIANWFLSNNLETAPILCIRADCRWENKKYLSAMSDYKKAFDLWNSRDVALRIVNLDVFIPNTQIRSIQKYLDFIGTPETDQEAIIMAQLHIKHSNFDIAEDLLYQSIYYLGNSIDVETYKNFLKLSLQMMSSHKSGQVDYDAFQEDAVITLEKISECQEGKFLYVCVNSQQQYNNDNKAIGVVHLSKNNPLYLNLLNKCVGDTFFVKNVEYKVAGILCKYAHSFRYVLSYFNSKNNDEALPFLKITSDSPEDMLKKISELIPTPEESRNRLDIYLDNSIVPPIETILPNNYDKYLPIVQTLLYSEDTLFYAGVNNLEANSHVFILTLPTLVLSEIFEFNLFEFKEHGIEFMVPESLLQLIKSLSIQSNHQVAVSPGSLHMGTNGELVLTPTDKEAPDFWNRLYEQIYGLTSVQVTDVERLEFIEKVKQLTQIDLEELFSMISIHNSQLDSLIVAESQKANLVTDDIFFRNIASLMKVDNTNHTFFYQFSDRKAQLLLSLSKTNYIYVPVYPIVNEIVSSDIMQEIWKHTIYDPRKANHYFNLLPDEIKTNIINVSRESN